MIKITQKIQAAYEVRSIDPNRWPPTSQSNASRMAQEVTRQWHDRQRATASLQLNRQLRRA